MDNTKLLQMCVSIATEALFSSAPLQAAARGLEVKVLRSLFLRLLPS